VAESLDGQYILVGECKWSDKTLNIERLFCDLRQKATRLSFVDKREIIYCMFLKNKTLSSEGLIFTAEDIIHTVIK
ncbi:ATP-binding protein, partial [Bacteroidales bacterium OttesenSCG-928-K22]|nr:ATP-binding protein [Bacteroidales bacterium OttesenSCG-928-K22]